MAVLEIFTRGLTHIHHCVFHDTTCPGSLPASSSLMLQGGARKQPEPGLWEESSHSPGLNAADIHESHGLAEGLSQMASLLAKPALLS